MVEHYMQNWQFIDDNGTFRLHNPHLTNYLYFPLVNEAGMMSVVTPTLHGDIKTGHNTFFSEPLSVEDLHNKRSARNFWVYIKGHGSWSLTGNSAKQLTERFSDNEQVTVEAGLLWHTLLRENIQFGLKAEITNFIPSSNDQVELMRVTLTNNGTKPLDLTPTASIPIYGRSADNLRDHRHVTSLLHRTTCTQHGILVRPTLSFDERGHIPNMLTYAVLGVDNQENPPVGFFPVVEDFIGEGGALDHPKAIIQNGAPQAAVGDSVDGYESIGGLRFPNITLNPGEIRSWVIVAAVYEHDQELQALTAKYASLQGFEYWFEETRTFWQKKLGSLRVESGDSRFDSWMRWVALQPILRRLFGNSFMPYHDYGRGGRGWRDLWQDILALLLMEIANVDDMLLGNFAGVRIDGSNATIIGTAPGEFKADRNNIPRIWMDHGAWPLMTVKLYIDQTGDINFLLREQSYFKDQFAHWTRSLDEGWSPVDGKQLRTSGGLIYQGTVLEHLLVQHLTAFFNVGDHNNLRLEDADWNDGMDMAHDKGESVAFTALYASNLKALADLVMALDVEALSLAAELIPLLATKNNGVDYSNPSAKQALLAAFFESVATKVSGEQIEVSPAELASDLRAKAEHLYTHLRENEWVQDGAGRGWFNGYYDNDGQRLEGSHPGNTRMTLTGQVFQLMGGIATDEQAAQMIRSAKHYLFEEKVGGYRLNTDFGEVLRNLGRAFGFAYGHKENGAMFSHMAVMYANALYQRGCSAEGFQTLDTIYQQSIDFAHSRMYPGIPEYFSQRGRGMYPYLTGSASWYLLTLVTQVFGVRGALGNLVLSPKLCLKQFDADSKATLHTLFARRRLEICYLNPIKLNCGEYAIKTVLLNGREIEFVRFEAGVKISRNVIARLPEGEEHRLEVNLTAKD